MATRDAPSVPRKKTTTYGKTSRKRPIHAFLDLTNGSRRPGDDAQATLVQATPGGQAQDPYDLLADEPEHRRMPRRDAPSAQPIPETQSDGPGNPKKRKVPSTVATKAGRKIDSKSSAAASQPPIPSHIRRPRSPHNASNTPSSRATKDESYAPAPGKPRSHNLVDDPSPKPQPPVAVDISQKPQSSLQIRQALIHSPEAERNVVRSSTATESSVAKPRRRPEPRRVRLIDQLAAQTEDSSESESDTSDSSESAVIKTFRGDAALSTPAKHPEATPRPSARPKQLLSTRKFRSTYGQQRTLRADNTEGDGLGSQMGLDGSQNDMSPPPTLSKLASFSFEDEDIEEETSSKAGIIDIHALRQAGANHRFADSMADLIDRVGRPQPPKSHSSRSRRTALLELASKLRDKTFVRQFRDQGAKDALFQAIGAEEDVISGFLLLSVLLVLFTSYSVPHLVPQLQAEGMAQLASGMFELDEDIVDIAAHRKSSLSRNGQASLGALRSTLQKLDVWKGSPPTTLSPRILALKVLSVISKDSDSPAIRGILASLTDQLFGFVQKGWETSRAEGMEGTEGGIALSLLEGCSIAAMESDAGPRWTKRYLPILADILTAAMARPMDQFGEFESTTLKLALNTTNNNPAAASAFSRGELFRELAETSLVAFELLQQSVRNGAFSKEIYEMLMLMLGVMINTSEHCPSTRQSVDAWQGHNGSPLDKLMDVYLDNRESAVTADSVEKTSVAVAHGYLAILLGYLSLGAQVRRRLEEKSHGRGIKYLLGSIQEFMTLHAKVDSDELATSLQNLVNELKQKHKVPA